MDIINHTSQWVEGEVIQGRIMLGAGILAIIALFYFIDFQQLFYKGMILPFILLQLVLLGYGGFQIYMRPEHFKEIQQSIKINSQNALKAEIEKVQNDDKVYSWLRTLWAALFIVSLFLFLFFKNDFAREMSFGFAIWFLAAFICDSFLHHRLKCYLSQLQQTL